MEFFNGNKRRFDFRTIGISTRHNNSMGASPREDPGGKGFPEVEDLIISSRNTNKRKNEIMPLRCFD